MRLSIQTKAWFAAGLMIPVIFAQDSSPGGPVHPGQPENCNGWHTVVKGDTCQSVPQKYGISFKQFLAWNPAVSSDCLTNFWVESAYCVRVGQSSSKPPTTSSKSGISISSSRSVSQTTITSASKATTSSTIPTSSFNSTYSTLHPVTSWSVSATSTDRTWPPTKTLAGQTTICNAWHRVMPGDTCQRLMNKYGFQSIDIFLGWNPAAKEDCEMLIADYWLCVGVQRQQYNTDLEWETAQPEFTEPPEPTEYTSVTLPTADSSFAPTPSQGPMPTNCKAFHKAEANQNCNDLVSLYGYFSQQQFLSWNPALDGNCLGLWLDTYYCVGAYSDNDLPLPAHQTTKPTAGNIPAGSPSDCARWYQTTPGDTCALIARMFGSFSVADFVQWNPSVLSDCSGMVTKAYYCAGRPSTPTTRTDGAPSPTQIPNTRPTQPGIATACSDYWFVGQDDTCDSIVRQAGISLNDFYSWNKAITVGSCTGLKSDFYVCVGVSGQGSSSESSTAIKTTQRSSSTQSATTTTAAPQPVETPSPVREGMTEKCVRFYLQQPGEFCGAIASNAGISLA
jgi:hypothetical protein